MWRVAAWAAFLMIIASVDVRAAPERMEQPHVVGVYGSVISIEHPPRQCLRDIEHSPLKVIHEAGLVLPAIKGDMVADASNEMRGEVFQLLPFGGFPRLHKFVDLLAFILMKCGMFFVSPGNSV